VFKIQLPFMTVDSVTFFLTKDEYTIFETRYLHALAKPATAEGIELKS